MTAFAETLKHGNFFEGGFPENPNTKADVTAKGIYAENKKDSILTGEISE